MSTPIHKTLIISPLWKAFTLVKYQQLTAVCNTLSSFHQGFVPVCIPISTQVVSYFVDLFAKQTKISTLPFLPEEGGYLIIQSFQFQETRYSQIPLGTSALLTYENFLQKDLNRSPIWARTHLGLASPLKQTLTRGLQSFFC